MAALNNFVECLEKELSCSICEELVTEPKQLHCLHSFCLKCIEKWNETCKNRRQRLVCPTCRSREDCSDVSKLRSSFYLESLKQLLLAMRNKASEPDVKPELPNCVSCQERVKLVAYCQQCRGLICTDCVNAHNKMKRLQHQVILFIDFKQEHVNSYISNQIHCQEKFHTDQKLDYFCQTCQKCICAKCSNTAHDTHTKINIEEKAEEIKQLITKDLIQVNQLKQKFEQELDLSRQNIQRVENEIETAKKEVSNHVQAQIKVLKDHENVVKTTLDEMFLVQKRANDEELNDINAVIQQLNAVTRQCNSLQNQNVDQRSKMQRTVT